MSHIDAKPAAYCGRFAPSPTGPLHLGSLTTALGSWLMARHQGGAWLLRIEDIDPAREIPGAARQHIRDLARFGMESDQAVVWQSQRSDLYADAAARLLAAGLAFGCRCSRTDLLKSNGIHHRCVAPPSRGREAIRLRLSAQALGFQDRIRGYFEQDLDREVGDVVIRRADGHWAYQLAVVVDDALQGITQVVRGADLIESTPRQIRLQQLLGYLTPAYAHLPVLRLADGAKLSKSVGSAVLDSDDPLPALRLAFAWLGQDPAELAGSRNVGHALARAVASFRPERIAARDQSVAAGPGA